MLYAISGTVVRGDGYGRKLGFPTANLDPSPFRKEGFTISAGVYAGTARLAGGKKAYKAGIVVGPVREGGAPKIEAYLLHFEGDLYGKELSLELQKFLRPFAEYGSEAELKEQIAKDVARVDCFVDIDS